MSRRVGILALVGLGLIALVGSGSQPASGAAGGPNIVVIQTDDQTLADLYTTVNSKSGPVQVMPNTQALIAGSGVTFKRYYATYPLSCPSRTTLLTGQYSHNHRVLANRFSLGGAQVYCSFPGVVNHLEAVPARLRDAGYRTIHVGRFLNGYPSGTLEHVPTGWDEWHTPVGERESFPGAAYFGYRLNDNGRISSPFGDPSYRVLDPALYFTDVITQRAIDSIDSGDPAKPFYLQFDHRAPHEDVQKPVGPQPAPRYAGTLRGVRPPHGGSFNEQDTDDKPRYVQTHNRLSAKDLDVLRLRNRRRLESLRSVDDSIATLFGALQARGLLERTYVFFIADNGFFRGEHRFPKGKVRHYEPATHVPLLIRGPGIAPGSVSRELVANVDMGPTILELAGASPGRPVDGRSLIPFATNPALRSGRPILLEEFTRVRGRDQLAGKTKAGLGNYQAIIAGRYKLVVNFSGEKELYDLKADPAELRSLDREPGYRRVVHFLSSRLRTLGTCDAAACVAPIETPPKPGGKAKRGGGESGSEPGTGLE